LRMGYAPQGLFLQAVLRLDAANSSP